MRHTNTSSVPSDNIQSLHLLGTKCFRPAARPNLVQRPQLTAKLDAALGQGHKLILVSAPAGFGKTTILTDWLARPNAPIAAWLALDDHDNNLGLFLSYLIATLETVHPGIGAEAWAVLRAQVAYPPVHTILTILLNALATRPGRMILILDDYHIIALQAIHEAVALLLDRMPAHMHVIITTRADPPLPLARLRVRGLLTEIRAADLRFSTAEAADLFGRIEGVTLSPAIVSTLEQRTEGWITGLQLAALAIQQNAAQTSSFVADFTGSHHYVFDYLADEVFQQQPATVQLFLLQTSILPRLCGPLSDALTGRSDGQAILEHLDQINLFLIRLDRNRRWYRYHHLFGDFLRERLERTIGAASRIVLHQRASAWFEQQGLISEAIDHALSAQAWDAAIRCMTPVMASDLLYGYYLEWPRWIAALPDTALLAAPDVCLRLAWILAMTGHVETAERPMALAEATWHSMNNQPKIGAVLVCRSLVIGFQGDAVRAGQLAEQALAKIGTAMDEQRGIVNWLLANSQIALGRTSNVIELLTDAHTILAHSSETLFVQAIGLLMARAYQLQGKLQQSSALYTDLIQAAAGVIHLEQPAVYLYLSLIHYEWNNLTMAEQMLQEGIVVGERTGRGRYWPGLYTALAQIHLARGDTVQANRFVEQALTVANALNHSPDSAKAKALQAWLWLAQGKLAAAQKWLTQALRGADAISYQHQATQLMRARIQIAQQQQLSGSGDIPATLRLLDELLEHAETDLRLADQITIRLLIALAHAANGEPDQAIAATLSALALAAPERYIRSFVDEGASLYPLLAACNLQVAQLPADQSAALRPYLNQILAAFPQHTSTDTRLVSTLLSEREQDVLHLLASGYSVQQIATQLIISVHTARTHIKNIYTKLDAHSRIQAVERARSLQLLP